jgi:outer membrane protein OmpA-like peptidoglycan-associated protein
MPTAALTSRAPLSHADRSPTLKTAALCAGVVGLALLLAPRSDAQNAIDIEVSSKIPVGDAPKLTIHVRQDLARVEAKLRRRGPGALDETVTLRGGPTKAGNDLVLTLPVGKAAGVSRYSGTLDVTFSDKSAGSMPLSFAIETISTLTIEAVTEKLDVKGRTAVVKLSRPAARVDIEVTGDDGTLLANQSVAFAGEPAGSELVVPWTPSSEATVLRISLVGHDAEGFFSPRLDLHPWSLSIPHEEVVFETGQAGIRGDEEPKLTRVLPEVERAIARYGKIVDVKLFIAGHTDTVGGSAGNLDLSMRRARTLATWFRAHGVKIPIYARGFGEMMLKKDTPDETDAVENRRADYVLAVNSPTGSTDGWHRVP